jgi:hypothetical protein
MFRRCLGVPSHHKKQNFSTDLHLTVTKMVIEDDVYVFNVTNNGPLVVTDAVLQVTVLSGKIVLIPTGWTHSNNYYTYNFGYIPVGVTHYQNLSFSSLLPSSLTACIKSDTPQYPTGHNIAHSSSAY